MATKLYPYKAECDKAGYIIHYKARDDKDAKDKLVSSAVYGQAKHKYKTKIDDWTIIKED